MEDNRDLIIRRVKKEELDKLVEVYTSAYRKMKRYAYTKEKKIREYLEWLYQEEPEGFLVAEREEKLTGFACIHTGWKNRLEEGKTGELHEIVVTEELQGKGIGKKLFKMVLKYAREKGCKFISLWVGEENWPARSWYTRLGFKEKGGWGEWVRMKKDLFFPESKEVNENKRKSF